MGRNSKVRGDCDGLTSGLLPPIRADRSVLTPQSPLMAVGSTGSLPRNLAATLQDIETKRQLALQQKGEILMGPSASRLPAGGAVPKVAAVSLTSVSVEDQTNVCLDQKNHSQIKRRRPQEALMEPKCLLNGVVNSRMASFPPKTWIAAVPPAVTR